MYIPKILAELHAERETLDEAIRAIEILALGGGKRRGRPPAWMSKAKEETIATVPPKEPIGKKRGPKEKSREVSPKESIPV